MKKSNFIIVFILINAIVLANAISADSAEGSKARALAEEAYFEIEDNVFSREKLNNAINKLKESYRIDSQEPYIYLASSLLTLVTGYTKGDWYKLETFIPGTVDKALELAEKAFALDPDLAQTHAHLARIYIVKRNFAKAREHLDQLKKMAEDTFYYWYFEGIFSEVQMDVKGAYAFLKEAEKRAVRNHQSNLVMNHRRNLAKIGGDKDTEERLHLETIVKNPNSPHAYGNYGAFLNNNDRYQKAVEQFKKAIELESYPAAIKGLSKAYNKLGLKFQNGDGIPQNYEKAMSYYLKGAELNYHYSIANVGYLYEKGLGVKLDNEEAKKWYRLAAENGNARGQYNLGALYDNERNYSEALKWYRLAASQSYENAIKRIKVLKHSGIK